MKNQLSPFVRWLISRFAAGKDLEILEGDFEEAMAEAKEGTLQYYRLMVKEIFGLMRLSHLQRKKHQQPSGLGANMMKVIGRNLLRKPSYTLINVIGLSISLAVFALILAYVSHELSYDRYHQDHERTFRITYQEDLNEPIDGHWARVPQDWINKLPDFFPQVTSFVRFQSFRFRDIQVGERAFRENFAFAVDPDVFEVFDFTFISGHPDQALSQPNSVVLTKSIARKYFDLQNPIGKTLKTVNADGSMTSYQVTGVIQDQPSNSHLPITLLTSINSTKDRKGWAYIYIKLGQFHHAAEVGSQMSDFIKTHAPDQETTVMFNLQPLSDIHLKSHLAREITNNNRMSYLWIFLAASIFLLVVAVINFTNLNTVQSMSRSREVGIRKVLGGTKGHLRGYFYLESMMLFIGSLFIAAIAYGMILPYLEQFMGFKLYANHAMMMFIALVLVFVVPWFTSIYPAQGLTRLTVIKALKSQLRVNGNPTGRKVLIGLQFGLAMALISAMHITQQQFQYLQQKNLGFQGEQVIAIRHIPDPAKQHFDFLSQELMDLSEVNAVTSVMELPGSAVRDGVVLLKPGQANDEGLAVDIQIVKPNFPEVMQMKFVSGDAMQDVTYSRLPEGSTVEEVINTIGTRKREYVINETAARMLGWEPAEAIGKRLSGFNPFYQLAEGPVVGVVQDYHQESLRAAIDPVIMVYEPIWLNHLLINLDGEDLFGAIDQIEEKWTANFPGFPMDMVFLDEELNLMYASEKNQKDLLQAFTVITLLIATLGLLGLMGFSLKTRQKELAIRQVLGADLPSIVRLLAKEYAWSLIIGVGLTVPMVWWLMDNWLQNYAYHTDIGLSSFLLGAGILVLLMVVPLLIQVFRNNRNPADILKSE